MNWPLEGNLTPATDHPKIYWPPTSRQHPPVKKKLIAPSSNFHMGSSFEVCFLPLLIKF